MKNTIRLAMFFTAISISFTFIYAEQTIMKGGGFTIENSNSYPATASSVTQTSTVIPDVNQATASYMTQTSTVIPDINQATASSVTQTSTVIPDINQTTATANHVEEKGNTGEALNEKQYDNNNTGFIYEPLLGAEMGTQKSGSACAGFVSGITVFHKTPGNSFFEQNFLAGMYAGYMQLSGKPNAVFLVKAEKIFGEAAFKPMAVLEAGITNDMAHYDMNGYMISFGPGVKYFLNGSIDIVFELKGTWIVQNSNLVINNIYCITPAIGITF